MRMEIEISSNTFAYRGGSSTKNQSVKLNLSLYSPYYAETCSKFAEPISVSLHRDNSASFEEMLQRWRAVGNIVSDQTSCSETNMLTLDQLALPFQRIALLFIYYFITYYAILYVYTILYSYMLYILYCIFKLYNIFALYIIFEQITILFIATIHKRVFNTLKNMK